MKKIYVLSGLIFVVFIIGISLYLYNEPFFYIPKSVTSVEVVTYNYDASHEDGKEHIKKYSKASDVKKFKDTFDRLKLGDKSKDRMFRGLSREIICYKGKTEVRRFIFHENLVLNKDQKYQYNYKELDSLLESLN